METYQENRTTYGLIQLLVLLAEYLNRKKLVIKASRHGYSVIDDTTQETIVLPEKSISSLYDESLLLLWECQPC